MFCSQDIQGFHFKSYLHYEMITSQNMSSKAKVENFFIL